MQKNLLTKMSPNGQKNHLVVEMCGAKNIAKTHKKELKFCVWHQINMNDV